MPDLEARLERHRQSIAGAKNHLGEVAGELRGGLVRYLELGVEPGSFLCAVIDNDLSEAIGRCSNVLELRALCMFIYNRFPSPAWGSKEKRLAWQERVSALMAEPEPEELDRPTIPDLEISTSQLPEGAVPVYAEEPGPEPIKVPRLAPPAEGVPVDARAQEGRSE